MNTWSAVLSVMFLISLVSWAQDAPRARSAASVIAEQRARDAETAAQISLAGAALYEADTEKRDWGAYCDQAVLFADRGQFRQAVRAASKALHLGKLNNNPKATAYAQRDLAYAYMLARDADNARRWGELALSSTQGLTDSTRFDVGNELFSPIHKVLGDAAALKGEDALARTHYEKAMSAAGFFSQVKPLIAIARANLELKTGNLKLAAEGFEAHRRGSYAALALRGLGEVALVSGKPGDAEKHFQDAAREARDDAYQSMWAQHGLARIKAQAGERVAGREAFEKSVAAAESLRAAFRTIDNRSGFFSTVQEIFDEAVTFGMRTGQHEWAFGISERSRARATLDETRGAGSAIAQVVDWKTVQAVLPAGTEVISFHVTRDGTHAWRISAGGLQGFSMDIGEKEVAQAVNSLRLAISNFDPVGARRQAQRLHEKLLAPAYSPGAKVLVIVPHRALHALPFNVLHDGERHLIEKTALATHLSVSLLADMLSRPAAAAGKLLALGNPDRANPEEDLPAAEEEVKAIASRFSDAKIFLREQATRGRLMQQAPGAEILHIAAHATVDEIDPVYSKILLAKAPRGRPDVEAHEIAKLDLKRSSLVVVSACSSGLGRVRAGEEFVGFKRAFAVAGAQRLMVSLWPVADDSTARTMIDFYQSREKAGTAEALRQAQVALLKDSSTSAPLFWAPFILVGDFR